MTPDEIKEQMELCDSDDRQLLTEEELSSQQNISHNSDNGYLYQDADFLCGAIIKTRKALVERNRLLKGLIDNASMDESMHFLTIKVSEPMFAIIQAALKGVGE